MNSRLELHKEFEDLLGSKNVYFQPPRNIKLDYDCIIYQQGRPDTRRADNKTYVYVKEYDVTIISKSPTIDLPERMVKHFMMCKLDRFYTADNLNHWVLTLYY